MLDWALAQKCRPLRKRGAVFYLIPRALSFEAEHF